MRTLLDSVIDITERSMHGGAVVVSENHDVGGINWVAGMTDPGEMIRCGYRPELRRLTGESDADYLKRITPLVAALPQHEQDTIKGSAIERASLDASTGRISLMVAGEPAWHGLGVQLAQAVTSPDAITHSGLGWVVGKQEVLYRDPVTGEMKPLKDVFAIVRQDTGAALGTVGRQYRPIQNAEGFAFLDEVLGRFEARYESAGAIYGGRAVWMLVNLPKQRFHVTTNDVIEPYAIFMNWHDGSGSARCFPTSQRVVCANTFRLAKNERDKGLAIRHTGDVKAKVADAAAILHTAVSEFEGFAEAADALVKSRVDHRQYFDDVLDAVCDVTAAEAKQGPDLLARTLATTEAEFEIVRKKKEREIEQRRVTLDDLLRIYETERCGVDGTRGTGWSAFNAVTESTTHGRLGGRVTGDAETKRSRKFESVLSGRADEVNQVAFTKAMQLAN